MKIFASLFLAAISVSSLLIQTNNNIGWLGLGTFLSHDEMDGNTIAHANDPKIPNKVSIQTYFT